MPAAEQRVIWRSPLHELVAVKLTGSRHAVMKIQWVGRALNTRGAYLAQTPEIRLDPTTPPPPEVTKPSCDEHSGGISETLLRIEGRSRPDSGTSLANALRAGSVTGIG